MSADARPTPRTDGQMCLASHKSEVVKADFARQLERELAEAREATQQLMADASEELADLKARAERAQAERDQSAANEIELTRQRDNAIVERDALLADLREMARLVMDGEGMHSYTPGAHLTECPECCRLSDLARKYAEEGKG